MNIKTGRHIGELGKWFEQTGSPLYLVGGCVRNPWLGLPVSDLDVCAAVRPEEVAGIANDQFHVSERAYGLGTVVISQNDGEYTYEYTAFRSDSYGRGGTHRPDSVTFTDSMEEDAQRRDFTVNALYADTGGVVLDPLGMGEKDLQARLIRMAAPFTMEQDALRILRMVRFAAELDFNIEPKTFAAAKRYVGQLADISKERIRDEFFKILMADAKYGQKNAVLTGLHLLKELGALRYVLPELLQGAGFAQAEQYHKYDVLEHSLHACAAACPDLTVRLAALLHDIAKPVAHAEDGNLYNHPERGAELVVQALGNLRAEKKLVQDVLPLIRAHMFDLDNAARKKAVARMVARLGKEQFLRLCCLREADFAGSGRGAEAQSAAKWRDMLADMEREGAPIEKNKLAINGDDIMRELDIPPGKAVGALLAALHEYAIKKPSQNNYKSLIRYARMLYTDGTGTIRDGKTE